MVNEVGTAQLEWPVRRIDWVKAGDIPADAGRGGAGQECPDIPAVAVRAGGAGHEWPEAARPGPGPGRVATAAGLVKLDQHSTAPAGPERPEAARPGRPVGRVASAATLVKVDQHNTAMDSRLRPKLNIATILRLVNIENTYSQEVKLLSLSPIFRRNSIRYRTRG